MWSVRGSRYVLHDRWIKVRADDCVTESGVEIAPFYVLEYPDFVHVLAFDGEDRVILVRQYRHGLRGISLELPGGMADPRETDPVETARRELREETGFAGGSFATRATLSVNPATFANRLHLVVARGVEPGEPAPDSSEDITVVRVTRAEARRLALTGGIVNAQHVGLLLMGLADDPGA